jgi:hypothetical protein
VGLSVFLTEKTLALDPWLAVRVADFVGLTIIYDLADTNLHTLSEAVTFDDQASSKRS